MASTIHVHASTNCAHTLKHANFSNSCHLQWITNSIFALALISKSSYSIRHSFLDTPKRYLGTSVSASSTTATHGNDICTYHSSLYRMGLKLNDCNGTGRAKSGVHINQSDSDSDSAPE